jgi:RNA polymerase sigma-70 factor (ECF subfamily)
VIGRQSAPSFIDAAADEKHLLARCLKGDSEAWDEIFDRHYVVCARFIAPLSPSLSPEDVEEICQETFLTAIRSLATFKGQSQFRTWLFRIAANKTRDFIERRRAQKRGGGETPVSLNAESPESGLAIDPPSQAPRPDEMLTNQERFSEVHTALVAIGEPCRETIELRYFGDLSYEEIGAALETNPKTVSSRLSKCLDKLQELMTTGRENSKTFSAATGAVIRV